MVCPEPAGVPGGVSTIVNLLTKRVGIKTFYSCSEVGILSKFWYQILCVIKFSIGLILNRKDLRTIYLQASESRSLARKMAYCIMPRLLGIPIYIHIHAAKFDQGKFERLLFFLGEVLNIRYIVLSVYWKEVFRDLGAKRIKVLHNPITDLECFQPKKIRKTEARSILFLGRVGYRKGSDILLDALTKVDRSFHVNIFGDGEVEQYRALADDLGLKRVKFHGWIGREQKIKELTNADILCLPSRNEGLPLAVLEGLGAGLCVVASDIKPISSVVADYPGVFLFKNGCATGLAECLRIISNFPPEKLQEIADKNQNLAKQLFDPENFIDNLLDILNEID